VTKSGTTEDTEITEENQKREREIGFMGTGAREHLCSANFRCNRTFAKNQINPHSSFSCFSSVPSVSSVVQELEFELEKSNEQRT